MKCGEGLLFLFRGLGFFFGAGIGRNFIAIDEGIDEKSDAEQNHRDTELLADVEQHGRLFCHLVGFEEFNEEAGGEDDYQKRACGTSRRNFTFGETELIDGQSDKKKEIDNGFVQL